MKHCENADPVRPCPCPRCVGDEECTCPHCEFIRGLWPESRTAR